MRFKGNTSGYAAYVIKILDGLARLQDEGRIQMPPKFSKENSTPPMVIDWINVGVPPLVPLSIYYGTSRTVSTDTEKLTFILKKMSEYMDEDEKVDKLSDVIRRYKMAMTTLKGRFGNDSRGIYTNLSKYLIEASEIGTIDDLWTDVYDLVNAGTLNDTQVAYEQWSGYSGESHEGAKGGGGGKVNPSDHIYGTRDKFHEVFHEVCHFDATYVDIYNAPRKVDQLLDVTNREFLRMVLAIRFHNKENPLVKVTAIDIFDDLCIKARGLPKYRSAAQNHLETTLACICTVMTFLSGVRPQILDLIRPQIQEMREKVIPNVKKWMPVDTSMFSLRYSALAAEEGRLNDIKHRDSQLSSYRDYMEEVKKKIVDGLIPPPPTWTFEDQGPPPSPTVGDRPDWCPAFVPGDGTENAQAVTAIRL